MYVEKSYSEPFDVPPGYVWYRCAFCDEWYISWWLEINPMCPSCGKRDHVPEPPSLILQGKIS